MRRGVNIMLGRSKWNFVANLFTDGTLLFDGSAKYIHKGDDVCFQGDSLKLL